MAKPSTVTKPKTAPTKTAARSRAKTSATTADNLSAPLGHVAAESSLTVEAFKQAIIRHLVSTLARVPAAATPHDWWVATSLTVRDHLHARLIATQDRYIEQNVRRLYYLSMEYLVGRLFESNLHSTGLADVARTALAELGVDYTNTLDAELDMGLGNGGLGRLAACFFDSLATLDYPAVGYGMYYEFGLFRQEFVDGHQVEHPDRWRVFGSPWEVLHSDYAQEIPLYGRVENHFDDRGHCTPRWVDTKTILGLPHDIAVAGYGTRTVNLLRLWSSHAPDDFDLAAFNEGSYAEATRKKQAGESISKVLYPNDKTENGKALRLVQQYFFVACSLRDILRRHFRDSRNSWANFADKAAIQLNDTHPAIAVVELMRLMLDEHRLGWDEAWGLTTRTLSYTNHTLLPEALEQWGVPLFERLLPRHLQLIYEINHRLMQHCATHWPHDAAKQRRCSLIEEGGEKKVRMANLAVVGSHTVNGVAALHTELLKSELFPEFSDLYPGKFQNKTNGITPRRWLLQCNPRLAAFITRTLGHDAWVRDLDRLLELEAHAAQPAVQREFLAIKRANKAELAETIVRDCGGLRVSPDALFDVQIKRLHEYKRQHLNLLHILALYRRLLQNPQLDLVPRVFIFAAKAAPGYDLAKNIIRAINLVATRINADERIGGKLKVAFLPNYRVSLAEKIIPAADLSEQISTAGKEASGTGNMKLALNGALTIGTLDGANVEIEEAVGSENCFIFGMTVDEVAALRARGYYPRSVYEADEELRALVDWIGSDFFTPGEHAAFGPLHHSLLGGGDPFMVLPDFRAYSDAQQAVDACYRDSAQWAHKALLNVARVGRFSSDRTIREYAQDIWRLPAVPVE